MPSIFPMELSVLYFSCFSKNNAKINFVLFALFFLKRVFSPKTYYKLIIICL